MYNFHCINNKWNLIYLVPSDRKSGHPRGRKCSSSSSCVRAQSCLTLCNSMDCSLPGSSVHGIFQARILEWVALPFSRGSFQPRDRTQVCHIAGGFFTIWATGEAQNTLPLCHPEYPRIYLHYLWNCFETNLLNKIMKFESSLMKQIV